MVDVAILTINFVILQWSYGVTCWEIFTAGQIPYAGTRPSSLLTLLQHGERLPTPVNAACDEEM